MKALGKVANEGIVDIGRTDLDNGHGRCNGSVDSQDGITHGA